MSEVTCLYISPSLEKSSRQHPDIKFAQIYEELIVQTIDEYNQLPDDKKLNTYKCMPAESTRTGSILKNVLEQLVESYLVLADLTDFNPNVIYELGIRFSFRRYGTILLCQKNKNGTNPKIPFDLQDMNIVFYSPNLTEESKKNFNEKVVNCIKAIEKDPIYCDSPVYIYDIGDAKSNYESLEQTKEENKALNDRIKELEEEDLQTG